MVKKTSLVENRFSVRPPYQKRFVNSSYIQHMVLMCTYTSTYRTCTCNSLLIYSTELQIQILAYVIKSAIRMLCVSCKLAQKKGNLACTLRERLTHRREGGQKSRLCPALFEQRRRALHTVCCMVHSACEGSIEGRSFLVLQMGTVCW